MSRSEAYQALAGHLGIDLNSCHFGWFDAAQCKAAAAWATLILRGDLQIPKTKPDNRKAVDSLKAWALNNGFKVR